MKRRDPEFICPKCKWYGMVFEYDKEKRDVTRCPVCEEKVIPYTHKPIDKVPE